MGYEPAVMRSGATRKGRELYQQKQRLNAGDAELLLHLFQHRADLLHGLADLLGVGFQGARPVVQGLGLALRSA